MIQAQTTTRKTNVTVTQRPANELAVSITGRPYISWSQVSCMRRCPAQFFFRYVQRVPPEFLPESLKFGSAVHSAIETFCRGLMEGIELSAAELQQAYRLNWDDPKDAAVPVKFNKGQDAGTLSDLAGRMLGAFLDSPLAKPSGRILAIEETVCGPVDEELPDVLARVDMVHADREFLHVVDYKTSKSRWNEAKASEAAEQLILYRDLMGGMARSLGKPVRLGFGVLTKAKKPVAEYLPVPDRPGHVEQLLGTIRQVWAAVIAGNFYPNPSPMNCSTCPYRGRCPAVGGIVQPAAAESSRT
ncbi:MAG: PD-(D/E)XK nuclease family protein [Planctomycetota bacterium]|nr:PD-(D/E)XK nuclease family protein [Planctomycetota bacterium]